MVNKSLFVANECIAECVPSCIGPEAYCASPGKCVCQQGYKLNGDQISCRPVCSKDCENGYCNAPNTCICNQCNVNWLLILGDVAIHIPMPLHLFLYDFNSIRVLSEKYTYK